MATHAIQTTELVKTYPKGQRALDGLTFSVGEGVVLGLLGPNGAGKSTTVKILTTLSRADSGTARVAGYDVIREQDQVRRAIGYVPQKSSSDPMATGIENLVLGGRICGLSRTDAVRRATELLARFGLTEFGRLAGSEGLTVLLTTHYLEEADRLADQLAIVDHGKIVAEGTPEGLKSELRGDSVHVELVDADTDGTVRALLGQLPGIAEIVVEGKVLRARVDHGATAVPAVLGILEDKAIPVSAVTVSRPSLDDVYLNYTGRSFQAAEEAA